MGSGSLSGSQRRVHLPRPLQRPSGLWRRLPTHGGGTAPVSHRLPCYAQRAPEVWIVRWMLGSPVSRPASRTSRRGRGAGARLAGLPRGARARSRRPSRGARGCARGGRLAARAGALAAAVSAVRAGAPHAGPSSVTNRARGLPPRAVQPAAVRGALPASGGPARRGPALSRARPRAIASGRSAAAVVSCARGAALSRRQAARCALASSARNVESAKLTETHADKLPRKSCKRCVSVVKVSLLARPGIAARPRGPLGACAAPRVRRTFR
ncbi:uncharacterized protein SOCE836_005010 [Sorangium cellulosum]|uniref:Uncharacterized protein n=1 Tax=Sorangium cellulosum TaxID=56 RepID=A0A4P2QG16_SORCE|nr:uncharacterized protein SOCE836_005010 [Sorangium cellulosum]WCQ87823.1 hypothetical protein NQZ70_00487 [Sorangium sp. Soce836]